MPTDPHPSESLAGVSIDTDAGNGWWMRFLLASIVIPLVLFAAIAPTLTWTDLSSGSENLVAATVLEMHRDGSWLIPNLKGGPRITKPPLTTWTAAALVPHDAVNALNNPNPIARDEAYRRLTWYLRAPALVLACLAVVATMQMGRLARGPGVGILAGILAGTTLAFLRFGRNNSTDVQLWLWVTVANVGLMHAMLHHRRWRGMAVAGLACGLAFMSKGPVALLMAVAPAVVWMAVGRRVFVVNHGLDGGDHAGEVDVSATSSSNRLVDRVSLWWGRDRWGPPLVGALGFLLVGLPWYLLVWWRYPDILTAWQTEVTRRGATTLRPDPWWGYISLVWIMAPWTVAVLLGLWGAVAGMRRDSKLAWVAFSVLVPVVLMSFFDDKPERYLLPIVSPAAVLGAAALAGVWPGWIRRASVHAQWVAAGVLAVIPAALMFPLEDGIRWSDPAGAIGAVLLGVGLLLAGWRVRSRFPVASAAVVTAVLMLVLQVLLQRGYAKSGGGRAEMKPIADIVWAAAPDADVYFQHVGNKVLPIDINIYLNRLVQTVADYRQLPRSARDQVVLVLQREREGEPPPLVPAHWRALEVRPWGKGRYWHVLVREPASSGVEPAKNTE